MENRQLLLWDLWSVCNNAAPDRHLNRFPLALPEQCVCSAPVHMYCSSCRWMLAGNVMASLQFSSSHRLESDGGYREVGFTDEWQSLAESTTLPSWWCTFCWLLHCPRVLERRQEIINCIGCRPSFYLDLQQGTQLTQLSLYKLSQQGLTFLWHRGIQTVFCWTLEPKLIWSSLSGRLVETDKYPPEKAYQPPLARLQYRMGSGSQLWLPVHWGQAQVWRGKQAGGIPSGTHEVPLYWSTKLGIVYSE